MEVSFNLLTPKFMGPPLLYGDVFQRKGSLDSGGVIYYLLKYPFFSVLEAPTPPNVLSQVACLDIIDISHPSIGTVRALPAHGRFNLVDGEAQPPPGTSL